MASFARMKNYSSLCQLISSKKLLNRCDSVKGFYFHTTPTNDVITLKMPSLSPTMTEGTIVNWQKKEGETVNPGDVLCEIQTDKAVMSFETEEEGILAKILMGDDSKEVRVGSLIGILAEPGEDWKLVRDQALSHPAATEKPPERTTQATQQNPVRQMDDASTTRARIFGPAVRLLLEKYGLSAQIISASGPRGSLLKGDVLNYVMQNKIAPKPPTKSLDLSSESSRIDQKPVDRTRKNVSCPSGEQEYQDMDLTNIRRVIAKRLTQSKMEIAHAYNTVTCNMDSVLSFRKKLKSDGIDVSINDIIIKSVGIALSLCPDVNVVWKGDKLVMPESIDVSVAVATKSGLITPIVTDVPLKGLQEIGKTVRDLADRARAGKLQPHEFQGGSFTISNLGMYGVNEFSAIINPPQCAILAVGGSRLMLGDDGKPVTLMTATLSHDAEAVSPMAAANFMLTLQDLLKDPQNLLLARVHTLQPRDSQIVMQV